MSKQDEWRALADNGDDRADYWHTRTPALVRQLTAALRDAADRLDAVQAAAVDAAENEGDIDYEESNRAAGADAVFAAVQTALTTPMDQEASK